MGQPARLDKMTLVRERGQLARRSQASKTPTRPPSSNRSDNGDHEDPLGLNKPRPSKAFAEPEIPVGLEAPPRPPQAPPLLIF